MRRIDITHAGTEWVAKSSGQVLSHGTNKDRLVRDVATAIRSSREPTSVRIHGKNGRIQEERTYPRGADPRASKG
jgi:hypothetical protein